MNSLLLLKYLMIFKIPRLALEMIQPATFPRLLLSIEFSNSEFKSL